MFNCGDILFVSYGGKANVYARVGSVHEDSLHLCVINGAYEIIIKRYNDIPLDIKKDYNRAINWVNEEETKQLSFDFKDDMEDRIPF